MYNGIFSDDDVSFASHVEITLKRKVLLINKEKHIIPLVLYIVSSALLQCLAVVVVSLIVNLLLSSSSIFIGSKEGCKGGLCIRSLKLFKFNGKLVLFFMK